MSRTTVAETTRTVLTSATSPSRRQDGSRQSRNDFGGNVIGPPARPALLIPLTRARQTLRHANQTIVESSAWLRDDRVRIRRQYHACRRVRHATQSCHAGSRNWVVGRAACRITPEQPALIHGETRHTYAEVADRVRRLARALNDLGVQRGDRVGWLGANHPAFLETLFAIGEARRGARAGEPSSRRRGDQRRARRARADGRRRGAACARCRTSSWCAESRRRQRGLRVRRRLRATDRKRARTARSTNSSDPMISA